MSQFHEKILSLGITLPVFYGVIAGTALVVFIFLWVFFNNRIFLNRLKKALDNPGLAGGLIRFRYSQGALLRRSNQIEKLAEKSGPLVVELTGMDDLWIKRLESRGKRRDMMRVLKYGPEKGLFACFHAALRTPSLATTLMGWLENSGDFLYLRKVAYSAKGKSFDGQKAYRLFKDKLDLVRELGGDPEWTSRYFASLILVHDEDERSSQFLWACFTDPHPLVRRTAVEFHTPEDRNAHYEKLHNLFIRDPAYEVRKAAWERLHSLYEDLYALDSANLEEEEALHVLELLKDSVKDDENFAIKYLKSENLELRLRAAEFLQRNGTFERMCHGVDLGDMEGLDRIYQLLKAASEVNVTEYLSRVIETTSNPATMHLCAKVVNESGQLGHLAGLLGRKVFALYDGRSELREVYKATLNTVASWGNEETLRLLNQELERRAQDQQALPHILEALPSRGAALFMPTLLFNFHNEHYPFREDLLQAIKRMPASLVLPRVLEIIKAPRGDISIPVRVEAVKLLGEMELHYCLQTVLENMWVFPLEEARAFMKVLSGYPRDLLVVKVDKLLSTPDTRIRAAIVHALPATGDKQFIPKLRKLAKDVDPDVRIACAWSLSDFEGMEWKAEDLDVLRDPVDRVRVEVAKAIGKIGTPAVLNAFKKLFDQEDESESVKRAALIGLGHSSSPAAIDIMVDQLNEHDRYKEEILQGLANKKSKAELNRLFDRLKDADPRMKSLLTEAFKRMGEEGGQAMANLLKEDISSLKPYILETLEETGHLEFQLRKLSHRDPDIRREAAGFLTTVGSLPAFRGLVMAAQDPDEEVRIMVIRALEKIASDDGNTILDALSKDPVRKVRRYTEWAMERVRAKSL